MVGVRVCRIAGVLAVEVGFVRRHDEISALARADGRETGHGGPSALAEPPPDGQPRCGVAGRHAADTPLADRAAVVAGVDVQRERPLVEGSRGASDLGDRGRARHREPARQRRAERVDAPAHGDGELSHLDVRPVELRDQVREQRAVARLGDVDLQGVAALDANELAAAVERRPALLRPEVADPVDFLDHAIDVIKRKIRDAPRTVAVASDLDDGPADVRGAGNREARRLEVREVHRARQRRSEVRVAGDQGRSGAGPIASDRPPVAAAARAGGRRENEPRQARVDPAPHREGLFGDESQLETGRRRPAGSLESGARERTGHQQLVRPGLQGERPGRVELDGQRVRHRPGLEDVLEDRALLRAVIGPRRVDAAHERGEHVARHPLESRRRGGRAPGNADGAHQRVVPGERSAENLRESPACQASQDVELPETILRHAEPERSVSVALGLGADVRYAEGVSDDLRLAAERGDRLARVG